MKQFTSFSIFSTPYFLRLLFLFLPLLFLFADCASAQNKGKNKKANSVEFPLIRDQFLKIWDVYSGADGIEEKEADTMRNEVMRFMQDSAKYIRPTAKYLIVRYLFEHMIAATSESPDTMGGCRPLQLASDEFKRLTNPQKVTPQKAKDKTEQYAKSFGLSLPGDIDKFYNSNFSIQYGLKSHKDCNFCPIPPRDTIPDRDDQNIPRTKPASPLPKIIQSLNGDLTYQVYPDSTFVLDVNGKRISSGKTPAEAIIPVINRRRFKTRYLEVRPTVLGQFGQIPKDKYGTFYEILFKGSNVSDTLIFGPGEFWINGKGSPANGNRWADYQNAMEEFVRLLFDPIKEFGPGVFEFVLFGSADSDPMSVRRFKVPYNMDAFKNIEFTDFVEEYGTYRYMKNTYKLTCCYTNDDLPILRSAYIRESLLNEPAFKDYADRIRIIKGKIEPGKNRAYRNCTMLLYLNTDLINGKIKPDLKTYKYSPIKSKA